MINILLKLKLALLCLAFPLLQQGGLPSEGYVGIVPLHTTRTQAETLLGSARASGRLSTYYFENETVELFYSKSACGNPGDLDKWNVPPDTVLSIKVIPKKAVSLTDLNLNLSKFRKERGSFDAPDESRLINDENGITLAFSPASNIIYWYAYGPKVSDRPRRCPNYSEEEERRKAGCVPATLRLRCSSEAIGIGRPVKCKVTSDAVRPRFRWTFSQGTSQDAQGGNAVAVVLTDSRRSTIEVNVKIVSPNVCFDTASTLLRVVKAKRTSPSGRR